jgi:hypothetical protein
VAARKKSKADKPVSRVLELTEFGRNFCRLIRDLESIRSAPRESVADRCACWLKLMGLVPQLSVSIKDGMEVVRFDGQTVIVPDGQDTPDHARVLGEMLREATDRLIPLVGDAADKATLATLLCDLDRALRQERVDVRQSLRAAEAAVYRLQAMGVDVPAQEQRVSYQDAIDGRSDLGLPPTAKSTLRRWIQNPQAASDLGVNSKGAIIAQEPLVSGLIKRHEIQKHRPPSDGEE